MSILILNSLGWYPNKHLNKQKDIKENNAKDFYFIWASERSGYRQLYLYSYGSADCLGNENILDIKNGFGNRHYFNKSVASSATCCNEGKPLGGGGPWIVDRLLNSTLLYLKLELDFCF